MILTLTKLYPYAIQALKRKGPNNFLILDSRAAVYFKLGEIKEAMKDARQTIALAPDKWQGYTRAARLFLASKKFESSIAMIKLALERLKETDHERRASLLSLEKEALRDMEAHRKRFADNMGKLPIELFGEIARILMQEDLAAPIFLSQVSKHWREVVHNIPFLWDTLVLTQRRPKQKAKIWLERSHGKLRELIVRSSALDVPQWSASLFDELEWCHLRVLRVQRWDVAAYLHSTKQANSLSNLECLQLDHSDNNDPWRVRSLPMLGDPQRLRQLDMKSMPFTANTRFTNLTSLRIQSVTFFAGVLFDFLKNNQSLEHLSIESIAALTDDQNKDGFCLPYLSTLELKKSYPIFIHSLDLPKLQILRVESPPPGHDSFLQQLVSKGLSSLIELKLSSVQCRVDTTINLLRLSENLEVLEVSNTSSHAAVIVEALANPSYPRSNSEQALSSSPTSLCPRLSHVNLSKSPDLQGSALKRMVMCRLPPAPVEGSSVETQGTNACPISSLVIDECPNIDPVHLPWLRENVGSISCIYMKKKAKFRA